ncbi:sialidase family protein [Actinocrispum wychmicini]|uniref:BNR/Asp-box repeat protein n=1 Tax=Actinocrispum wychmicini TaxID=1213861 RepID=A0A4R2J584_9PSEU|nr:hypothetical protein [Actinocrispum wychmicini]TCO53037.1 BNR/Asp-box repeat protein [Actinocrispum wychmicini]
MPDLDTQFTSLRRALSESTRQPDMRDVIERARRRTARRRTQLVTVVLVALVAIAVPLLRKTSDSAPAVGPTIDAVVPPVNSPPFFSFYDSTHGVAMWSSCGGCANDVLQTTEDGRTWQTKRLPSGRSIEATGSLWALGPRSLLFITGGLPQKRWFSKDDGTTWQEVPAESQGTIPAIPPGGILAYGCYQVTKETCPQRVQVIRPDSGTVATLAGQPPFRVATTQQFADAAGTWWVNGVDDAGIWMVASSRDNGRSWQTGKLDMALPDLSLPYLTTGPDAVYATLIDQGSIDPTLLAVFRSTDGGRTWEHTWRGPGDAQPQIVLHPPVVQDGKLTYVSSGVTYVSDDGGKSFHKSDIEPRGSVLIRDGYLRYPIFQDTLDDGFPYELPNGVRGRIPRP